MHLGEHIHKKIYLMFYSVLTTARNLEGENLIEPLQAGDLQPCFPLQEASRIAMQHAQQILHMVNDIIEKVIPVDADAKSRIYVGNNVETATGPTSTTATATASSL